MAYLQHISAEVSLLSQRILVLLFYCCKNKVDAFELWCWGRLLRAPWTAKRSSLSILNEISPEYSLERLMLKIQYFSHLMRRADSLEKTSWWERLRAGGKRATEDEMVGWHHQLSGHEFEQTPGDSEGQGSLACGSPWGCKESDMTEWVNNNNNKSTTNLVAYNNVNVFAQFLSVRCTGAAQLGPLLRVWLGWNQGVCQSGDLACG